MTKEALKLAAEMERGQFSTTLLPAAAELRRLHEENRKLKAQEALNKKAENARELGLDYEPTQEPCGGCGGSGWVTRDPDIGTDQECFVCGGSGAYPKEQEQEPVAWEGGEGWESLAWELCADENGEDSCNELIWEGGPIPEPWGDRWMKYEEEAKRLIALVQKHTTPPPVAEPHKRPSRSDIKPLTEQEIGAILEGVNAYGTRLYTFARAIEAAHGIKENT